ncbi:MAG: two-component system LytT family sensor kinase [Saprospiraceae bacterium]|jgi:two-component system LytT family sensor kinase
MNLRQYILCFILLVFSGAVYGQKEKTKADKSKRQTSQILLEQARAIKEKSPAKAISLVEQAITKSRNQKKGGVEGEAYILLGSIYEQIDQNELALQRYQQALAFLDKKREIEQRATLFERIGQLYLLQGDDGKAETNFTLCLDFSRNKILSLKCEEGLADVRLLQKDTRLLDSQLDSLGQKYQLDSMDVARVEARRSQNYIQQNEYSKASESYTDAINSLPQSQQVKQEDFAQIQKAQNELLQNNDLSNAEKIDIRSNIASNSKLNFSNDVQVLENLKIADLYESDRKFADAEKYINFSKKLINPTTDAAVAAEVFKKSSQFNQRQGKVDAALDDLELYISSKEQAIQELENDLKEQVDIVKGQQQIDLLQRDYDLEEKDKELLQSQLQTQKIIIGLLSLVLLASLVFFYFLYKNVKAKRKANQSLLLKSLRTQMNPHFIFNALNSVNNFIAKNDEKAANKFLSSFSKLMRKVLDYSQKDFITFEEEIELNELYLKLEHFRFRDKFDYTFRNDAEQDGYNLEVPPMLIQPFIENAVWHGLRYKSAKGKLDVTVTKDAGKLIIRVKDNGIGREKSRELKTKNQMKYKSTGLENVSKRIALINEIYNKNYEINVSDLDDNAEDKGTVVEIKIPVE